MVVADVLSYWYSIEVPRAPRRLQAIILIIADSFSLPLLLRTLFSPWRKDIIPTSGLALPEKLRIFGYNLVSVLVGFVVRFFVLVSASLIISLTILAGAITLVLWLILPVLPIFFFFAGLALLFR